VTEMVWAVLVIASLAQLPAPDNAPPAALPLPACVLLGDEAEPTRRAADAAIRELGSAHRVQLTNAPEGEALGSRCGGIVALGQAAWNAARASGVEPVVGALVANLQLPAGPGRLGGVALEPDPDGLLAALAELSPAVRKVGLVYDPAVTGGLVRRAQRAASGRGLELVAIEAADQAAAIRAFHRMEKEIAIDALWILPDRTTTTFQTAHQALKRAHWKRIPVIGPSRWYVAQGALFAPDPTFEEHGRLAAQRLLRVKGDEKDPPIVYPPAGPVVLNRRTLGRLGLRMPAPDRVQVREVIE
jgi:putative tryptophan/tyrosine transport system substrate-binding protein